MKVKGYLCEFDFVPGMDIEVNKPDGTGFLSIKARKIERTESGWVIWSKGMFSYPFPAECCRPKQVETT